MSGGGDYIAAAYLVFLALVLVYVAIMAARLSRLERELAELNEIVARRDAGGEPAAATEDRVGTTA